MKLANKPEKMANMKQQNRMKRWLSGGLYNLWQRPDHEKYLS